MSQKRSVRRDSEIGGASDRLLSLRANRERRKLVAAQQVEQLENRVSRLTNAAKRAASENALLTTRIAQLEQHLQEARAAPRFEEADAQAKSDTSDEPSNESSSGFDAMLENVPVGERCNVAQRHYDACLAHDDNFNLLTGLDGEVFLRQLAVFTPFIATTTNIGTKATYKLDPEDWVVPLHLQFFADQPLRMRLLHTDGHEVRTHAPNQNHSACRNLLPAACRCSHQGRVA
jgi:hypothetical protein